MRANMIIVGVGERKQGVKNNKPYDFTEIAVVFEHHRFTGQKAEVVTVTPPVLGDRQLTPGDTVDVVYHEYNYRTFIDAIL